jgi:hypothetical protein
MLICLLFTIGGLMFYDLTYTKEVTVRVNINQGSDPFETLPKIVSSGGRIVSVKQCDVADCYEVKVVTRKSRQGFLAYLLKSDKVQKAELEE